MGFLFNNIHLYILYKVCLFVAKQQTDQRNTLCMSCSIVTDLNSWNCPTKNPARLPVIPVCHTKIGAKWPEYQGPPETTRKNIEKSTNCPGVFSPGLRHVTCQIEFFHQGTSINSSCGNIAIVHDSPRKRESLKMWSINKAESFNLWNDRKKKVAN